MLRTNQAAGSNLKPVLLRLALLILIIGLPPMVFFLWYNAQFRFVGIRPGEDSIGLDTTIILEFNKDLTNTSGLDERVKVSPETLVTTYVERNTIVIVPVESYSLNTYAVSVPVVQSNNSRLESFKLTFTPNQDVERTNPETAQDLDDIAIKKYPALSKVGEGDFGDYRLQYSFDGVSVVFDAYLIEPLDVDEDKAFAGLRESNRKMRSFVQSLNIPKEKYVIRYQNETQQRILYGNNPPPAN